MKNLIIGLIALLVLVAGCSQDQKACQTDADCVPQAICHPHECINSKFLEESGPMACTMIYDWQAAYSPEDCICIENICINKNLGRTGEESVDTTEAESTFSLKEAIAIAQNSECTAKGVLLKDSFFNENSLTWWIELKMNPEFAKDYCNPACVIYQESKTAEINWRCTGLLLP